MVVGIVAFLVVMLFVLFVLPAIGKWLTKLWDEGAGIVQRMGAAVVMLIASIIVGVAVVSLVIQFGALATFH